LLAVARPREALATKPRAAPAGTARRGDDEPIAASREPGSHGRAHTTTGTLMKQNVPLTISSLLSIVLFTVHLAHDFVFGLDSMTRAGTFTFFAIMLVSLYGTVELAGRRSGYIIMLLVGTFAAAMPVLHTVGGPRSAAR